jgi:hypothetical protein
LYRNLEQPASIFSGYLSKDTDEKKRREEVAEMSSKKAFLRAGLPLVGLLVGGSVLLSVVRQSRWKMGLRGSKVSSVLLVLAVHANAHGGQGQEVPEHLEEEVRPRAGARGEWVLLWLSFLRRRQERRK